MVDKTEIKTEETGTQQRRTVLDKQQIGRAKRIPMSTIKLIDVAKEAKATPHTPEPWKFEGHTMVSSASHIVASVQTGLTPGIQLANAQRIVECVNACAGIKFPAMAIQAMKILSNSTPALIEEVERLRAEREELLGALNDISQLSPKTMHAKVVCFEIARKISIKTIKNAKGGHHE